MNRQEDVMFDLAEIACWKIDVKGEIYWSDNLYKFYGEKRGFNEKGIDDFESRVYKGDYPLFKKVIESAISSLEQFDLNVRIMRNGLFKWVNIRGRVLSDGSIEGCTQDIDKYYRKNSNELQRCRAIEALIKSNGATIDDLRKLL